MILYNSNLFFGNYRKQMSVILTGKILQNNISDQIFDAGLQTANILLHSRDYLFIYLFFVYLLQFNANTYNFKEKGNETKCQMDDPHNRLRPHTR